MLRVLDFSKPIEQMTLQQTLNQIQFPNLVHQSPSPSMGALPQSTPITLMMEVSRWITELQSSVILEPNTNFIKFDIPV
jgi:hypothetical protein